MTCPAFHVFIVDCLLISLPDDSGELVQANKHVQEKLNPPAPVKSKRPIYLYYIEEKNTDNQPVKG